MGADRTISKMAATWHSDSFGTHGGDGDYVLESVEELVDNFIDEYLRVNNAACGGP